MSFIPYQGNPQFLLPPRVGDFIPQDDLCWVTAEVVDMLDSSGIKDKYSDYGTDGYHPGMLLKLVLYTAGRRLTAGARKPWSRS